MMLGSRRLADVVDLILRSECVTRDASDDN
jgi:hypothetical protein